MCKLNRAALVIGSLVFVSCALGQLKQRNVTDDGLVAHWAFDEGKGDVLHDRSGNKNNGKIHGAKWVKNGAGWALKFDGKDDYVDCGAGPSLDLRKAMSIDLWIHPEGLPASRREPGIAGRGYGSPFLTYGVPSAGDSGSPRAYWYISGGGGFSRVDGVYPGSWHHIVGTFDGKRCNLYRDGWLLGGKEIHKKISPGGNFLIGKNSCPTYGGFFRGLIGDVRVYNRALSAEEVLASFKKRAASFGKDTTRPLLRVEVLPALGRVIVSAEYQFMRPLPEGAMLEGGLHRPGTDKPLVLQEERIAPHSTAGGLNIAAGQFPPGKYEVRVIVKDSKGKPFGKPSVKPVDWPGQPKTLRKVKILNNLVWELLNAKPGAIDGVKEYRFTQPKRRWVHVSCTAEAAKAKLSLSIDSAPETSNIMVFDRTTGKAQETMRFLPAGEHVLLLRSDGPCRVEGLVVRSIPELIYSYFFLGIHCRVREFGLYGLAFLEKYVLKNANVVDANWCKKIAQPFGDEWKRRGGKWLLKHVIPYSEEQSLTIDAAYKCVAESPGFRDPLAMGTLADEFGHSQPRCAVYAAALRKLKATPKFRDKVFYPYVAELYTGSEGRELVQALIDTGSGIVWKRALKTPAAPADERGAREFIRKELVDKSRAYRTLCPGSIEHMVVELGHWSIPGEFLQTNPSVNYKVYLDMLFNTVANEPAFFGTYGLNSYVSTYTDEETLRWVMRLLRHYAIEGNTEPATNDPYDLPHLVNGDFAEGTHGWTVRPAQGGSIRSDRKPGFGWLQGRWRPRPEGETVLVTLRSGESPNVFTQEIKGLDPGRLYSFRMYTGDFKDMSKKEKHAVTIKLDNVTLVPEKCFTHVFHNINGGSHSYPPYDGVKKKAWMNYHWRVFRAKGTTAKLSISDWASDKKPGGSIGQELMCNFIQIQPYFDN